MKTGINKNISNITKFLDDDKNLVIMAVTLLGGLVIFNGDLSPEQNNILNSLFSGLFGIAVGKTLK